MESSPSNVVANETEPCVLGVLLHDSPKSTLRVLRHRVCFIENDDFVRWAWICLAVRCYRLCAWCLTSKVFDLFAHDVDATLIRGVKF